MKKTITKQKNKNKRNIGSAPGTLVYTGDKKQKKITIDLYQYNSGFYKKEKNDDITKIFSLLNPDHVNWININGIHKIDIVEKVGDYFSLHPLLLEDILTIDQAPKFEEYDDYLFFTLKMLNINNGSLEIEQEHVSFILGKNYVISFQEKEGDIFDLIRIRIEQDKGKVRKMGADFLFYLLIDTIVDYYYLILDKIEDQIDNIEDEITFDFYKSSLNNIIKTRKEIIFLKRAIHPLRDAIRKLKSSETKLISIHIQRC